VVRQRILIPPYGGSNPPAPANKCSRFFILEKIVFSKPFSKLEAAYASDLTDRDTLRPATTGELTGRGPVGNRISAYGRNGVDGPDVATSLDSGIPQFMVVLQPDRNSTL
jgi:hypothetical protein